MNNHVRVNRDHNKHRWTVHSLTHKHRLGHAESLVLRDVLFVTEADCGWADGELWAFGSLVLDPKFPGEVEARDLPWEPGMWIPLVFREGKFYLENFGGEPLVGCSWLRTRGRYAEVLGARTS